MWQALINEISEQHAFFDEEAAKWVDSYTLRGGRIFCGKGCRECCNLAVNGVFTEALHIAEGVTSDQARRVREFAGRLLENTRDISDLKSYLRMHRKKMGFCPFLDDDGSCGIYDVRSFSCRSLLATRESRFCGLDFTELSRDEQMAFIAGLDLQAVSFPMHYAAATQELGQDLESRAAHRMAGRFGFSLYGSLPFLVFLQLEHHLSRTIEEGFQATLRFLKREGLGNPCLVMLDRQETCNLPS